MVECERILSNLLEKTPEAHRDFNELGKVVSKFKQVCLSVLIQSSTKQIRVFNLTALVVVLTVPGYLFLHWLEKGREKGFLRLCPEMHANEIHELYDRHLKVSPNLNSR